MDRRVLFVDTETGGLNPSEHSLLSIGLVVWENNKIIDMKELYIKHETYNITAQAINTNKINLIQFSKIANEPRIVVNELIDFLSCNFKQNGPITLGGHNTNFDINFMKAFFSKQKIDFNKYFSHRFIDTASILKYLYFSDIISEDLSSSDKAFKYFNIEINKRHSALGDAIGTAELFSKMIDLIK